MPCVQHEEVIAAGVDVREVDGLTPIADLVKQHCDFVALDVLRIGELARCLGRSMIAERAWKKLSLGEVKKMLKAAVDERRVDLAKLQPKVRDAVT